MEQFIHVQNLLHFRAVLQRTTDPLERARILALLVEEEAKEQASHDATNATAKRS